MRGRGMIGGEMKGGQRQWEGGAGGWGRKSCGVGKEKVRLKERADEGHERAGWHY